MAIEDFKHLIEAQSLEKTIKDHLNGLDEQTSRVNHIEKQREIFSKETEELSSELKEKSQKVNTLEKDLASTEAKLEKTNEHIPLARNENEANALQKEVDSLTPKAEDLQNQILEFLEELETLEAVISEKKEFLEGSAKSLELIRNEAEKESKAHQASIDSLKERVDSLLGQANDNHKVAYEVSCKKHQYNNPLCFVIGGSCSICRYTINQMQADEVEKGEITESCPGCGRLLTPLSAKNF